MLQVLAPITTLTQGSGGTERLSVRPQTTQLVKSNINLSFPDIGLFQLPCWIQRLHRGLWGAEEDTGFVKPCTAVPPPSFLSPGRTMRCLLLSYLDFSQKQTLIKGPVARM